MKESPGGDSATRLTFAFVACLGRPPTDKELASLCQLFSEFRVLADADHAAATKLAGMPQPSEADLSDTAAAIAVARVILNLDEFVTRE